MRNKITLSEENLYIIRSTRTHPDNTVSVLYYETVSMWNKSPMMATIFQNHDAGMIHLNVCHSIRAKNGWADGTKEVMDLVPLYGEILNSPNSEIIHIKPK